MSISRAAHLKRGAQIVAHAGPIGLAEDQTAIVGGEVHTAHASRFAVGHTRDGGRDRKFDAARATADATIHATLHRAAIHALFVR
jgi:hypothetical protein